MAKKKNKGRKKEAIARVKARIEKGKKGNIGKIAKRLGVDRKVLRNARKEVKSQGSSSSSSSGASSTSASRSGGGVSPNTTIRGNAPRISGGGGSANRGGGGANRGGGNTNRGGGGGSNRSGGTKVNNNTGNNTNQYLSTKKYFGDNDPGKKLSKKEIKKAQAAGISMHKISKYMNKYNEGDGPIVKPKLGGKAGKYMEKFQAQMAKMPLADYDPSTAGGKGFGKKDIKYLMSEEGGGHSAKEIKNYMKGLQKEGDTNIGGKAQNFLGKKIQEVKMTKAAQTEDVKLGAPSATGSASSGSGSSSTPEPTTPETKAPSGNIPEPSLTNTMAGGSAKTIEQSGRNNYTNTGTFIGNNNQGADFSVNIGDSSSDNMKNAMKYMEINNNAFEKSQARMSGSTRAAQAVATSRTMNNTEENIARDDYMTRLQPLYMGARGTQSQVENIGDTFKFDIADWKMPKPPKKPKDKLGEIADSYKN